MLTLDDAKRKKLWRRVGEIIERYIRKVPSIPVAPELNPKKIRSLLLSFDFQEPLDPIQAVDRVAELLTQFQVHTPHPRYFGLFNPTPATMGIAADALVAAFNPQLAAWSHSPFAVEVERHLVQALGSRLGYPGSRTDGIFTSGGAEANFTALLTALTLVFPEYRAKGARALPAQPAFYISSEGHHSFLKASQMAGLGAEAVREVPVDSDLRIDIRALEAAIKKDRAGGLAPFMVVGTAGTTSAGAVDPIASLARVALREQIWFHLDAAWGGAAALVPDLRAPLSGIELADSITLDAHKWLSIPMGAGLYLTRHPNILGETFQVAAAHYMPAEAGDLGVTDPYSHSVQWSRRFIGLKLFLSLCVAGWDGYARAIRHMTAMGDLLRRELQSAGWRILNNTALPVVCFGDEKDRGPEYLDEIARRVVDSGKAWISTARVGAGMPVLRACITSHRTDVSDIFALIRALNETRQTFAAATP